MASATDQDVALQPPSGQVPNFINPKSLEKWNLICVLICLLTTTTVLVLRNYVRLCMKREWRLEDYMCCLSWGLLVSFCACGIPVMKNHGGVHEWDLTKAQARESLRLNNISSIIYGPAIGCTKISILLLYRRVFSPLRKSLVDRTIRYFIAILLLFYAAVTFAKIFACTPRSRIWDERKSGRCINIHNLLDASGAFNTVTDVLLLLIPVKISWILNASVKRKVGAVLLFTFGFLAPAFSITGLAVRIKTSKSPDVAYNLSEIILWGEAEITTGLICVCIPPLAALTHPRLNRRQKRYIHVYSSKGRPDNSSRRSRLKTLEERGIFSTSHVELQSSGIEPAVAFPHPVVTAGTSGGRDAHGRSEKSRREDMGSEVSWGKAREMSRGVSARAEIGATSTVEQYHR